MICSTFKNCYVQLTTKQIINAKGETEIYAHLTLQVILVCGLPCEDTLSILDLGKYPLYC